MDSKRRHELETNDLRDFLDNFKDFWEKNGNSILIVLILVVGSWAGLRYYKSNQEQGRNEAWWALAEADTPEILLNVADEYSQVHDIALLQAGDRFNDRARGYLDTNNAKKAKEDLAKAQSAYESLIADADDVIYKINAGLGMGANAEMRRQWDEAATHYTQAAELAGERFAYLGSEATIGLDRLDKIKNQIAFAEDIPDIVPEPLPAPLPSPNPFGQDVPGLGGPGLNDLTPDDLDGNGTPDSLQAPGLLPAQ